MVAEPHDAHRQAMPAPTVPPVLPPPPGATSPTPSPPPAAASVDDGGGRAGALLVAATGAFLLFAAAVVFVAVRWGQLPESVKVAIVGGCTAILLAAGRLGRRTFPSTATAVFHLGAFLVPVDVAALLVRSGAATEVVLTVTGMVAAVVLGIAARLERSPVLGAGAVVGTVVAATGVGWFADGWVLLLVLPGSVVTAWCALGAVRASRRADWVVEATLPLALLAVLVPAVVGAAVSVDVGLRTTLVALLTIAWVLGVALDRTHSDRTPALGALPRVASVLLLPSALGLVAEHPWFTAGFAGLLTLLVLAEALRLRQPALAGLDAVAAPVAVASAALALGATVEVAGLVTLGTAVAPLVAATRLPRRWAPPAGAVAAALAATGTVLAVGEPSTGATALLVVGGLLVLAALLWGAPLAAGVGGTTMAVGYWWHLDQAAIDAADALVVPVVAGLGVVGLLAERRRSTSSWFTLTPPLALLGVAALSERVDGGAAVHGVVAGAVGVLAVLVGGRQRALGPLVTGAALLVALTVYETVAVTAGVPTWGWLALGGALLLGAGMALDRADTGPVEAGRHLREVVGATFH